MCLTKIWSWCCWCCACAPASARARGVCPLCLLTSVSPPKVRGAGCSFHRSLFTTSSLLQLLLLYCNFFFFFATTTTTTLKQLSQGGLVVRKAPGVSTATYIFWGRSLLLLILHYYYCWSNIHDLGQTRGNRGQVFTTTNTTLIHDLGQTRGNRGQPLGASHRPQKELVLRRGCRDAIGPRRGLCQVPRGPY
jgi:hypothetical protein